MADTLEGLKNYANDIKNSITEWTNKRQGYLDKAEEIRVVYERLKGDKDTISGYKKDIKKYAKASFEDFVGNNYQYGHKPKMDDLQSSYDTVIEKIDANLDALNEEKLRQQNLASNCLGPLGELGKAWHTVQTKIQNWTN